MATDISPFGKSYAEETIDLAVIKYFGATVANFSVSADWASQAGSLRMTLVEDEAAGDRFVAPVIGSPVNFELKDKAGNILFQYIGFVNKISRKASASSGKTYDVELVSPLKILESTHVILDGYVGLGGAVEGAPDFSGLHVMDYGHRNNSIIVDNNFGIDHWHNVSNLINVYGIFENEDPLYRVPLSVDASGNPINYGTYGAAAVNDYGMPLVKLLWGLHMAINHLPAIDTNNRQRTLGGNLLFGRHNYNINQDPEGIPYYYHFDALDFYNQVQPYLGDDFRIEGKDMTLLEIISKICDEANLDFYCYIDIYNDPSIGRPTLQENDPNWTEPAVCNWPLNTAKFINGGNYGGTIRIQTVEKWRNMNSARPYSNIAYNLIGLEVPDLKDAYWTQSGVNVHPGKRPINDTSHGLSSDTTTYSDPLDSAGIISPSHGFTDVGTLTVAEGGSLPTNLDYYDSGKLNFTRVSDSDISVVYNDITTMKVVIGGNVSRVVTVPRKYLRHFWGYIHVPRPFDPRQDADTNTDPMGLNEYSTLKVPVVTQLLNPVDIQDFILIDMKDIFGNVNIEGVLHSGVYAASMLEIRSAMSSQEYWESFIYFYKPCKVYKLLEFFFPDCNDKKIPIVKEDSGSSQGVWTYHTTQSVPQTMLVRTLEPMNKAGAPGYVTISALKGAGNSFAESKPIPAEKEGIKPQEDEDKILNTLDQQVSGFNVSGIDCMIGYSFIEYYVLPRIYEKVKQIGDTHYGKSWYVPVPYAQVAVDLNGNNLVGNFKTTWMLSDGGYEEPAQYYDRKIPQSNLFVSEGLVKPFVNYDYDFISVGWNIQYDVEYMKYVQNAFGNAYIVFNFSEYDTNQLCYTDYSGVKIIHAAPEEVANEYSFIPYPYEDYYNRAYLPFIDRFTKAGLRYPRKKSNKLIPLEHGQSGTTSFYYADPYNNEASGSLYENFLGDNVADCESNIVDNPPPTSGYWHYNFSMNVPCMSHPDWLSNTVEKILNLDYYNNGWFSIPYVYVKTGRVTLPILRDGFGGGVQFLKPFFDLTSFTAQSLAYARGSGDCATADMGSDEYYASGMKYMARQNLITRNIIDTMAFIKLYPAAVIPESINYTQRSTRYFYGPWITNFNSVAFRGKIEYEVDESLVPENFLVPVNYGNFGNYSYSQISGITGMNLVAQSRANAIDNFALFAVEEGSITIPGAPAIKRIGEPLYNLPQITDISISFDGNGNLTTNYSFKTFMPRFGKHQKLLEKRISKISSWMKKLKMR